MDIGTEDEEGTTIPDTTPVPELPNIEPAPVPAPVYEPAGP